MMFQKILLFLFCCFTTCLQGAPKETLVVGTNAEFPPFCYVEEGEIIGFDIDIAKEVVQRLGKEMKLKDMPFDALIPELVLEKVDFAAAGMSYAEERAKRVSFTKPYLQENPLVIFSKEKLELEDLKGKSVVVIEGFTADLFMSSQKGVKLLRLTNQSDGFMTVKYGRADAFVTARNTVNSFLKLHDSSEFQTTPIGGTGDTCSLVVPKGKKELLEKIQAALDEMESDGTIEKLKTKWSVR